MMPAFVNMRYVVLFLPLLTAIFTYAQKTNPRLERPHGISIYGVGPNMVGSVAYDYFFTPHVNAETGLGFIGVHIGMKVHLQGGREDKRWTPYLGASLARSLFPSVGSDYLPYFPVGIHYVGCKGFNFALEAAPLQLQFLAWNVIGVKVGTRF